MSKKTLWITRAAIFSARLIAIQARTAPLGNTIITGPMVNMTLIILVMTCGFASGLSVAILSPVMAKFAGVGPFWNSLPFIAAGNIALVSVWHFVGNRDRGHQYIAHAIALHLV